MKSTPNRIQARREELGWSREDLAQRLKTKGVKATRMRVWRIETGATDIGVSELRVWARALRTTAARLVA